MARVPRAVRLPCGFQWLATVRQFTSAHSRSRKAHGVRRRRRQTVVSKVIQHPSKVVEVQMKKPSMKYKPGQYLFLNCPDVSRLEWHPFTISSAPEEDFVSVHVRVVGDWTSASSRGSVILVA